MKSKKLLATMSVFLFLVGCGQQPELDVDANNQAQQQQQQNTTQQHQDNSSNQTEPTTENNEQTDLSDQTGVVVTNQESTEDENNNQDETATETESLASKLSGKVIYFDFDKYNIRDDQISKVQEIANIIKDENRNFTIRIEGNCDEWGSDEYNYALGLKRAKTLKQALINLGVDGAKLTIISYGETNPVCLSHNRSCWAKNRRDNLTVLP